MSDGTPVVATPGGWQPDVIAHERDGLLVRVGDQAAVRVAMAPPHWTPLAAFVGIRSEGECGVLDYYCLAESRPWGIQSRGYIFFPGHSFIEFLPYPSDQNEQLWEIVGTGLWNTSMPLVRYRTGDLVRLPAHWRERERDEAALGFRPSKRIEGRGNRRRSMHRTLPVIFHGFWCHLHDVQNISGCRSCRRREIVL